MQNFLIEKVKCPDDATAKAMVTEIDKARDEGDTVGGVIKMLPQTCHQDWVAMYIVINGWEARLRVPF